MPDSDEDVEAANERELPLADLEQQMKDLSSELDQWLVYIPDIRKRLDGLDMTHPGLVIALTTIIAEAVVKQAVLHGDGSMPCVMRGIEPLALSLPKLAALIATGRLVLPASVN
jgi:hypothetical protein